MERYQFHLSHNLKNLVSDLQTHEELDFDTVILRCSKTAKGLNKSTFVVNIFIFNLSTQALDLLRKLSEVAEGCKPNNFFL